MTYTFFNDRPKKGYHIFHFTFYQYILDKMLLFIEFKYSNERKILTQRFYISNIVHAMLLHFDKAKFFSYESWYTNVVNLLLLRIYYSSCINFHFFSDLSHRHIMLTKLQFIYIFRDIKIFSRSGDIFGLEFLCLLKFIVIRIYYYTKEIKDNNIWKIYVVCIIR